MSIYIEIDLSDSSIKRNEIWWFKYNFNYHFNWQSNDYKNE